METIGDVVLKEIDFVAPELRLDLIMGRLEPLLDHLIVGGAAVAMDVEAGARKLAMEMGFWHPSGGTPTICEVRPHLDAILSACGIIVPDEAGVVKHFEGSSADACVVGIEDDHPGHRLVVVSVGDTITVTKPKEG